VVRSSEKIHTARGHRLTLSVSFVRRAGALDLRAHLRVGPPIAYGEGLVSRYHRTIRAVEAIVHANLHLEVKVSGR
jgi:hypothetical protein